MGPSTSAEALQFLAQLTPSTIRLGLDRIEVALATLGHPQRRTPAVHVAGTNGKGSTCAFVASVLQRQGYRVGLYTSPHLVRINERFRIDGQDISDQLLGRRILEVLRGLPQMLEPAPPLSYFELCTVVAFHHFASEGLDIAVLETGLGGRLDATNVVRPLVSGVTPISFDHQALLGRTLREIAGEKAGIIKPGIEVVTSRQVPEVAARLVEVAAAVGAPLRSEGADFRISGGPQGTLRFEGRQWRLSGIRLGLRGPHQRHNAALALALLEVVSGQGFPLEEVHLLKGLELTRWEGRLEELSQRPTVVLDGAHNMAGIDALLASLDALYSERQIHLVFGALRDKDVDGMVSALFPRCASVHLAPVASDRSVGVDTLASWAERLGVVSSQYSSVEQAFDGACQAAQPGDVVLAAGSLVLVGQVRKHRATGAQEPGESAPSGGE